MKVTVAVVSVAAALLLWGQPAANPFVVSPYLQLGNAQSGEMRLLWHTADASGAWSVEWQTAAGAWKKTAAPVSRRVAVGSIEPHRVWTASLTGLPASSAFNYRVQLAGREVFRAEARTMPGAGAPRRIAVTGDIAAGTDGQREIAVRLLEAKPDYVVVPGDIVYSRGLISEYREKFFPVYNADRADPKVGAPLLRSLLWIGVVGNHDVGTPLDLEGRPEAGAYFHYWDQPLNGPATAGPPIKGEGPVVNQFKAAAGPRFPRMQHFSFDDGLVHWTMIDSNSYVDLNDPALRAWIQDDLKRARNAAWRFVALHHPPFNSSQAHFSDQRTRYLATLFEEGKVDIVFAGHVHNYQRTHPLLFKAREAAPPFQSGKSYKVEGEYRMGEGPLYIVTGAGGARLYDPSQTDEPNTWQPYTVKFFSKLHSFSIVEVEKTSVTLKQIDQNGAELDRVQLKR